MHEPTSHVVQCPSQNSDEPPKLTFVRCADADTAITDASLPFFLPFFVSNDLSM